MKLNEEDAETIRQINRSLSQQRLSKEHRFLAQSTSPTMPRRTIEPSAISNYPSFIDKKFGSGVNARGANPVRASADAATLVPAVSRSGKETHRSQTGAPLTRSGDDSINDSQRSPVSMTMDVNGRDVSLVGRNASDIAELKASASVNDSPTNTAD